MQSIQRSNEARRSADGRAASEPEAAIEGEAGAKVEPVGERVAAPGARAPHAEGRDGPAPGGLGGLLVVLPNLVDWAHLVAVGC